MMELVGTVKNNVNTGRKLLADLGTETAVFDFWWRNYQDVQQQ